MKRVQEEAKAALVKAKNNMAHYYDYHWTPALVYKLRDSPEDPIPSCCPKPPPPPVLVNDEKEYEVEEILDSRIFQEKLQLKVKWKGYGIEDISWKP
ncbi:hypothetical protein C0989_008087 [Termitomyces sp. Mn162]|nr:hypothetical protein C0989_008087 [Termitomyces sp. Mn162]